MRKGILDRIGRGLLAMGLLVTVAACEQDHSSTVNGTGSNGDTPTLGDADSEERDSNDTGDNTGGNTGHVGTDSSPTGTDIEVIPMNCSCEGVGRTPDDLLCAIDICDPQVVVRTEIRSDMPFDGQCSLEDTYVALSHYGSPANQLAPRKNHSYALLATGVANSPHEINSWDCNRSDMRASGLDDPVVGEIGTVYDPVEWMLTLTAPDDAQGFRFKYVFFSMEYDDYISSPHNDKFYAILNAPMTTGGADKVINYTGCRDPYLYFDFSGPECDVPSGFCCYVAINSALSDCCWYPYKSQWVDNSPSLTPCAGTSPTKTDISGTGYECASSVEEDGDKHGSSTGWLQTTWPIEGGETFTLVFHLHDTADGWWDSAVLIDAFEFLRTPGQTGTIEIPID